MSVKKPAEEIAQSAPERKAAEAELRSLIEKFASDRERLITAVRKRLQKRLPTAHEIVYEYRDCFVISYSPSVHGYEGVLALRGSADDLKLYFNRGKGLPDPESLLQGSGGMARFILVEAASTLTRPEVAALIEAAIDLNSVPFAETGRGSILVRPTTAKNKSQAKK